MIWATLAAQLAKEGLPILAEQMKKNPARVVREIGAALDVPATPAKIEAKIASDPDALDKLAEIEAANFAASEASIASAREAHKGHWMPPILTLIYVWLFAAAGAALMFVEMPPLNRDVLLVLIGALVARFTQGGDYWLGSSRGSADKQAELARIAER